MTSRGPFTGVRVLDLSQGPVAIAGMILADYGAEVIKIEPPGGERFRSVPAFAQWNRGKRGGVLDATRPAERQRLLQLVSQADVMIDNFRPGVAERIGVDYGSCAARNPRLIGLSISGFGVDGPDTDLPAYEGIVAA